MEGTQEPRSGARETCQDALSSHEWDEGGAWDLWIGPGERLDRLGAVLEALSAVSGAAPPDLTRLADLEDLALAETPARGRLVLDADALPAEDLGYLRRFLERTPGFELAVVGDDVGRGALRRLSGRFPLRWLAWPPDLAELEELVGAPRAGDERRAVEDEDDDVLALPVRDVPRAVRTRDDEVDDEDGDDGDTPLAQPAPSAPARVTPSAPVQAATRPTAQPVHHAARGLGADEARELAAIQAVLDLPPLPADLEDLDGDLVGDGDGFGSSDQDPFGVLQDVPTLDDELEADEDASELDPFAQPEAPHRQPTPAPAPQPRAAPAPAVPGHYRAQIADLADIAQRVDLALRSLRPEPDRAAPPDDGYEPLAAEVARLLQFTRTLSYLVAPPPRGAQTFDLGVLVEEVLDQTVELGPEAPRCVFRRADGLVVRSDKGLLVQALDAFVVLALACAGPGELIRVQVRPAQPAAARLSLEFPSGPLADLSPERIAEPYALRARLPSYGPNALGAASGIVAGQGGAVRLARVGDGRLELQADLPLA